MRCGGTLHELADRFTGTWQEYIVTHRGDDLVWTQSSLDDRETESVVEVAHTRLRAEDVTTPARTIDGR